MAIRQAYKASIELAFDYNGRRDKIEPEKIVYVMIDWNYDKAVMPIIYISLSVSNNLYTNLPVSESV